LQATQALPPAELTPQAAMLSAAGGMQVVPEQQPWQLPGPHPLTHEPPWQLCVEPVHAVQAAPPVPQELVCWATGTQVVPWQQPAAQLFESQTGGAGSWQVPDWHACRGLHC
jgi:hypothetical protein